MAAPRYMLLTSRDLDPEGKEKAVRIGPGETRTLCKLKGTGRIVRFWLTLPIFGQGPILKDAVLRIFWDGESEPSVETPLGDFFGASFGRPRELISDRLVVAGGAYLCRFEMPFNSGAVFEVHNQGSTPLRHLFFQIGFYEEDARDRPAPTLHAQYRRENPTAPGTPFTVLQAKGSGRFAGLTMDMQCQDWWLRPPLTQILWPRGFGLGILEGWERITVDGDTGGTISGTGAEDYFSGGFYFMGRPICTATHGCTHISLLAGRTSAYRLHIDDPIHFQESLDFKVDHGLENSIAADFTSVAYWYQLEPHAPFPALPDHTQRRTSTPWKNLLQWTLLASIGGSLALTFLWLVGLTIRP